MARFNMQDAENYGAVKNSYFSLKDDGDTAVIRFLYNDINDVEGVATHEVTLEDGKKIDVECLRAYNEPLHKCPLCEAGYKVNAKLFIPIYDVSSKESKIWTRGRTFFQKLSSLCSRYNPLVSMPFEIERCGKKGDTNTTYETYPTQMDDAMIEDFPEIKAEGLVFQVKTPEEMQTYLETGSFGDEQTTVRNERQSNRQSPARNRREQTTTPVRRRPASYNNEDSF